MLAFGSVSKNLHHTFKALPTMFPLLHETSKHLRLHEHLQKPPQALRGNRLAERLTLERGRGGRGGGGGGRVIIPLPTAHEERVMAHYLHEEAHKGL